MGNGVFLKRNRNQLLANGKHLSDLDNHSNISSQASDSVLEEPKFKLQLYDKLEYSSLLKALAIGRPLLPTPLRSLTCGSCSAPQNIRCISSACSLG